MKVIRRIILACVCAVAANAVSPPTPARAAKGYEKLEEMSLDR